MEMQFEQVDIKEAKEAYECYKEAHCLKQSQIFYEMHRDEHWFREKYDPQYSFKWKSE
jgi:hypothetical protein